ncbi:MAG: hypothetical protein MR409_05330 [Lachnospiraceae bacterium]|nr:hypothetical protein [Lachnospiraceae bacterium]
MAKISHYTIDIGEKIKDTEYTGFEYGGSISNLQEYLIGDKHYIFYLEDTWKYYYKVCSCLMQGMKVMMNGNN